MRDPSRWARWRWPGFRGLFRRRSHDESGPTAGGRSGEDPGVLRRRAEFALDVAKAGKGAWSPAELRALGRELEAADLPLQAADAFALAGDEDGELRALAGAGAVERLEAVFDERRGRERKEETIAALERRIADLRRIGQRRRAAGAASRLGPKDARFERVRHEIEVARIRGPLVRLELDGVLEEIALGDAVTIGRDGSTLPVASPSVSRRHLEVSREPDGPVVVNHSKNGTTLRGARVERLPVGAGLELLLGGEVPVKIAARIDGNVDVELGGRRFVAPLGPLKVGTLSVRATTDGWVVLESSESRAVLGDLEVRTPFELVRGDVVKERRDGAVRIRVIE